MAKMMSYYSTTQLYNQQIQQPRTAFSYKDPFTGESCHNATLIQGQVRKYFIQVRPPTQRGKGTRGKIGMEGGRKNKHRSHFSNELILKVICLLTQKTSFWPLQYVKYNLICLKKDNKLKETRKRERKKCRRTEKKQNEIITQLINKIGQNIGIKKNISIFIKERRNTTERGASGVV